MPSLNITDFKGHFISGARPNLYKVRMSRLGEHLEFLCKSASIPGSTIEAIDVPYLGRNIKVAGNRIFDDWSVTIFNDIDFGIRKAVEKWMDDINGHQSNLGFARANDVYSDAQVQQLGRDGAVLATYSVRDMFPTSLSEISLGFEENNSIEEFEVTFAYNYWQNEVTS